MSDRLRCCCKFGAAVSGEYPEFGCALCPIHKAGLGETERCGRHAREAKEKSDDSEA